MKRYVHYRADLADKAALDTYIGTSEAKNFPVGSLWVTADGKLNIVSANDGSTVTTIAVGAQTADA
jgi:myo-inositol-hexaphosphate 3-phosphohydrolase